MASYAKQAHDNEFGLMATRIRARAYRQCGILLKAMEPARTSWQVVPRSAHALR
jgi:hypothetical protein